LRALESEDDKKEKKKRKGMRGEIWKRGKDSFAILVTESALNRDPRTHARWWLFTEWERNMNSITERVRPIWRLDRANGLQEVTLALRGRRGQVMV